MDEQSDFITENDNPVNLVDECDSVNNVVQNNFTSLMYIAFASVVAYAMLASFALFSV